MTMKLSRLFHAVLLIAAVLLFGGCSTLIEPEKHPADITLEELEARMGNAMDPHRRYRDADSYLQHLVTRLSTWYGGADILMKVRYEKPDKFRFDYIMDGKPLTSMIYNGSAAYVVNYKAKETVKLNDEEFAKLTMFLRLGQPDSTYSNAFPLVELYECEIEGVPYYWIRCYFNVESKGNPYDVFVDKDSYLIKRVQLNTGRYGEYTAEIEKYSEFDSVIIPDVFVFRQNGLVQECDVVIYKLDANIAENAFDLPPYKIVEQADK